MGRKLAAGALGIALGLAPNVGRSQPEAEVTFAIPALTLTFTAHFVAEDAGFFQKEGLKVSTRNLVGVASANAVLAGSADFTMGTGPVFLRAAAQGQRFFAIANLVDRPMVELVLRKDVAEAAGITDKTPPAERAKMLKGKTIAIQGLAASFTPGSAMSPTSAASTLRTTCASRRWSRRPCCPRSRTRQSTATPHPCRSRPSQWLRGARLCS